MSMYSCNKFLFTTQHTETRSVVLSRIWISRTKKDGRVREIVGCPSLYYAIALVIEPNMAPMHSRSWSCCGWYRLPRDVRLRIVFFFFRMDNSHTMHHAIIHSIFSWLWLHPYTRSQPHWRFLPGFMRMMVNHFLPHICEIEEACMYTRLLFR